ncbi:hypothetical protein B0T11DRAFT_109990 [Plectosphaerella cucumerina]|uniref:Calcofluor white hypersensitive protein n=1 Tax=Plectosphaerella cucumerina TaxID=40658 RepID=A0A8K0X1P6_9PEZI|nr:hypothetical protein B0T11DRAFT_109990 [Plectosphaerella cucumerina]
MSKSRAPLVVAAAAAGGIGYYLYGAGGSPKVAEKRFESDVHKASAEVKSHLPGSRDTNVQHNAADAAGRLGAKIDNIAAETDKQLSIAKSNAEAYAKEAKANAMQSVNEFDRKVEDKAAQAKSGVSSWFSSGNAK